LRGSHNKGPIDLSRPRLDNGDNRAGRDFSRFLPLGPAVSRSYSLHLFRSSDRRQFVIINSVTNGIWCYPLVRVSRRRRVASGHVINIEKIALRNRMRYLLCIESGSRKFFSFSYVAMCTRRNSVEYKCGSYWKHASR
jgi:hypothetical protein